MFGKQISDLNINQSKSLVFEKPDKYDLSYKRLLELL